MNLGEYNLYLPLPFYPLHNLYLNGLNIPSTVRYIHNSYSS
nr:MAG TPA: hypothetical protein [Caudoviricetes sp.]